ncbi:hypothetical protein HanHA300_Chr10g0346391 [Helianthus annuus]|nr:hypothetical protein HanHA300_Chr10g0346391 [Helianthus annuus]KAJ0528565.1 hypothetical protein HanHA89_Chr10g0367821 [Helianthus annuus]KAJ0695492.1 hypothetical protein HanLR1_Chr10g0346231 [Helianthus annuus]KAJ0698944.1 hypothetical protein HanOQP8_Chr10g0350351 [Helianthus annuus]
MISFCIEKDKEIIMDYNSLTKYVKWINHIATYVYNGMITSKLYVQLCSQSKFKSFLNSS